jgi:hypothetical protein
VAVRLTIAQARIINLALHRPELDEWFDTLPFDEALALKRGCTKLAVKYGDAKRRSIQKQVQAMTGTGEVSPPAGP